MVYTNIPDNFIVYPKILVAYLISEQIYLIPRQIWMRDYGGYS